MAAEQRTMHSLTVGDVSVRFGSCSRIRLFQPREAWAGHTVKVTPDVVVAGAHSAACGIAQGTTSDAARHKDLSPSDIREAGSSSPSSSPISTAVCSLGCWWVEVATLRSPSTRPYEALVCATRTPRTIRVGLGRKCASAKAVRHRLPLLGGLAGWCRSAVSRASQFSTAQTPRRLRMSYAARVRGRLSYVPSHPSRPRRQDSMAVRYGPSYIAIRAPPPCVVRRRRGRGGSRI